MGRILLGGGANAANPVAKGVTTMAHAAHVGGHNMRDMTATSVDEMSSANFVP